MRNVDKNGVDGTGNQVPQNVQNAAQANNSAAEKAVIPEMQDIAPENRELFTPVTFTGHSGVTVSNRFVMAPMVIGASTEEGEVTEADLAYWRRRAAAGGMLITGSAAVGRYSEAFKNSLGVYSDEHIPGLTRLAQAMKSRGAKAILQIYHAGREAKYSYEKHGRAYAPSPVDYSFLDYPVTELSTAQVEEIIAAFAQATRRAAAAGFDGVEIHGANHYLLQQFFSRLSNHRTDEYGERSRMPWRVLEAVKDAAPEGFIIGYRICPEEIHGEDVGYTIEDSVELLTGFASHGLDYVHTSVSGETVSRRSELNARLYRELAGKTKLIATGKNSDAASARNTLRNADLVGAASTLLLEPDFPAKVAAGAPINRKLETGQDLALPEALQAMFASK